MRITDFPLLHDIKVEYVSLRREGNCRQEVIEILKNEYKDELTLDTMEDGLLFWIGLADVQYAHKEITTEVSEQALAALQQIETWGICAGDIQRRVERYSQAPMPEKTFQKARPPFSCPWEIGDTFAYLLSGTEAEKYGIAGKYALLRKVGDTIGGLKGTDPVVTITLWEGQLPSTAEEFSQIPLLKLEVGGRQWSPLDHFEYRTKLVVNTKKQLKDLDLIYLGRLLNVPMPEDEIIFKKWENLLWCDAKTIDQDIARFYKRNCDVLAGRFASRKRDPFFEMLRPLVKDSEF